MYNHRSILNTDQTAFEFEMHSSRTLSFVGEKSTLASVRSTNKITHRYTVQQTINLAGQVVGPVFVCLQEKDGRMGERVRKNLFHADNVVTTCSASGKLTTSLVRYWVDKCLSPSISHSRTLLLSDSWSGQGNQHELYDKIRWLKRLQIPFKTTSKIEPLDTFCQRQWKAIARRLYDRIILDDIDINATERNSILKLQSLIHNQLPSPVFMSMIKYAWFKAGYLDAHPGSFRTVTEVCFGFENLEFHVRGCSSTSFIRCSYCDYVLCIEHFFDSYHFHWSYLSFYFLFRLILV